MQVKTSYIQKIDVTFCPSNYTAEQALKLLKESGYRCIPVVDLDTNTYKGQIYKIHLYEHVFENGKNKDENVMTLVTQKDSYLKETTSITAAVLNIDALPFLAVVDDKKKFKGIVTHSVIMDLFRDGFGVKTGGYCLTVALPEIKGVLSKLISIFKEFNIEGLHTFDNGNRNLRRITVTLSKDAEDRLQKLKTKVESSGFRIIDVEEIQALKKD